MSYGNPSEEVAEDFKMALGDLNMNSRYEISNLTVIAKENTEHALAISNALKNHIKQVGQILYHTRVSSYHSDESIFPTSITWTRLLTVP